MHDSLRADGTLPHGARWDGADLLLAVRVIPRAAADAVAPQDDCLKIRLTAPPVDGKANEQLRRLLGKLFGVPRSRVIVEAGDMARHKRVRIVEPRELPEYLRR